MPPKPDLAFLLTRLNPQLRGDAYRQHTGALRSAQDQHQMCCLGVAFDLWIQDHPEDGHWHHVYPTLAIATQDDPSAWHEYSATLPRPIAQAIFHDPDAVTGPAVLQDPNHPDDSAHLDLAQLNDSGYSFEQLAEIIEAWCLTNWPEDSTAILTANQL